MSSVALMLAGCAGGNGKGDGKNSLTLVVGTYTDAGSDGIYTYRFDLKTGESTPLSVCKAVNPSYLTITDDGSTVYAVSELNGDRAGVYTLSLDAGSGTLTERDRVLTGGADPCYIATDGRLLVTANYSGGSMSLFKVDKEGLPTDKALLNGTVGGPDVTRQQTPHVHCCVFSPDGCHIFATDFSADRIMRYDITDNGIVLEGPATMLEPDYGPRHLVFNAKGDMAYVIGELSGKVTAMSYRNGILTPVQTVDADPNDARGSADIHLSPDGRFLYASNRLKGDGISIFSVADDGTLTDVGYQLTGIHPRQFNITPDGRYLLCACRDSDCIQVYRRDAKTGMLTDTGNVIKLSHPVCVMFL